MVNEYFSIWIKFLIFISRKYTLIKNYSQIVLLVLRYSGEFFKILYFHCRHLQSLNSQASWWVRDLVFFYYFFIEIKRVFFCKKWAEITSARRNAMKKVRCVQQNSRVPFDTTADQMPASVIAWIMFMRCCFSLSE